MSNPTLVGLIPARQGSKRVKAKNIRSLAGHPLLAYTIAAATQSGVFADIVVSTDSELTATIANHYGARVPFLRPSELARDHSPDIEWIDHALQHLAANGCRFDCFSILRPTSPFRQAATIQRAWTQFLSEPGADSLRAVERCSQHPGKMWVLRGRRLLPLLPLSPAEQPWHSTPSQALPTVYVQNASLEIAWSRIIFEQRTIAGETVVPFVTDDVEGFDINSEYDWAMAEQILAIGTGCLPSIHASSYQVLGEAAA